MKPSEILEQARALVAGNWYHGDNLTNEAHCPITAIYRVATFGESINQALKATDAVRRAIGVNIPEWNDAPERTLEEVLAAMDKARELALADGR